MHKHTMSHNETALRETKKLFKDEWHLPPFSASAYAACMHQMVIQNPVVQ